MTSRDRWSVEKKVTRRSDSMLRGKQKSQVFKPLKGVKLFFVQIINDIGITVLSAT